MSKFQLRITTYVGIYIAEHYYATIKIPPERVGPGQSDFVELTYFNSDWGYETTRFLSQKDVVEAAKTWFLASATPQPGDKLTVWRGYLSENLEYGDRSPIGY